MTIQNRKAEELQPQLQVREPAVYEGLMLAVVCGMAYILCFYLNAHVVQAQTVFSGVALFYLPAGVKLIALMVARYWGALGLWAANFLHTATMWEGIDVSDAIGMSIVWLGTTFAVVMAWARFVGLRPDLKNLTFQAFLWLNLLAALVHGMVFNAYMVMIGFRDSHEWLSSAKAMALGDFLGSGALMLMVVGLFKASRWLRR
jgi:hypothetical protein